MNWDKVLDPQLLRQGNLDFRRVSAKVFLHFVKGKGRSPEAGPIGSQYEEEFKANSQKVGAFGLYACGELVGLISYGLTHLRSDLGGIGVKLDVVVTHPAIRGMGIGALLIAYLFDYISNEFGKNLQSVSTVAVHPLVARCVSRYGLKEPPAFSKTPLYTLSLGDQERKYFAELAENEIRRRIYKLRQACGECKSMNCPPWCREKSEDDAA